MSTEQHSIWLGSVAPSAINAPIWGPRPNADLQRLISGGRPLIVIGRNSTSSGRAGARDAAEDFWDVLNYLADVLGFDIRSSAPSIDELVEILMASPNKVTSYTRDGKKFLNRFALIDLSQHGVIGSISAGSARKIDADLNQPHVSWVQRLLREIEPSPVGFIAKRFDRVSRALWQTGGILQELREIEALQGEVWAGDVETGRWPTNEDADFLHASRGQAASREAVQFRAKTVRGVLNLSGTEMVDGRVPYALSGGVPPGLFTYRDRRADRNMLCIDSPSMYPSPDEVEKYLPDVRDESGQLVDQAETVRWFIREFARPGVTARELFRGLLDRRYSTHTLRQFKDQGPTAYYGGPSRPVEEYGGDAGYSWMRAILLNLDLYETGILERSFGPESEAEVAITNVFPAAGSWGDPEDFARIRAKLAANDRAAAARREWSWSGMPINVDGVSATLRGRRSQTEASDVSWVMHRTNDSSPALTRSNGRKVKMPPIPDGVLTAAILRAVVEADGKPLQRFITTQRVDDDTQGYKRQLQTVTGTLHDRRQALDRRYAMMMETDPDRAPRDGLLDRLRSEYYALEAEVATLEDEQAHLERRLSALGTEQSVGLPIAAITSVINGLRNPHTNELRQELRSAVHNLTATTRELRRAKLSGVEVVVQGDLVIDAEAGPYSIPFLARYATGPATEADERALRALKLMRNGHVARFVGSGQTHQSSVLVAELLGVPSTQFAISACHDPLLLKLGMAALYPTAAQGEDPADVPTLDTLKQDPEMVAAFGDVAALANRIRRIYGTFRGVQWLTVSGGVYETQALIRATTGTNGPIADAVEGKAVRYMRTNLGNPKNAARQQRWTFMTRQWPALTPCRWCGHVGAALLRIREVDGYMCLNSACRRDRAGVRWPLHFDQYISNLDMWVGADVDLHLPDGAPRSARSLTGAGDHRVVSTTTKWRQTADLDDDERRAIADAYADRSRTVTEIQTTFRVSFNVIYDIVEAMGLTPRRPTRAKWHTRRRRKSQ